MLLRSVGLLFAAAFIAGCTAPAARPVAPIVEVPKFSGTQVVLLGTGMPRPDPAASGPATAVTVGEKVFLFDAGAGVMRRINGAGLPINGVTALFVTHLHSDHTLGYPDLIFTSWVMGRKTPLQAYGPPGLQRMTDHLLAAYSEDIAIRVDGLERGVPDGFKVDVHEIAPGVVFDRDGVRVTAIRVPHGSWKAAYGFRIDTPDRSVVISGDTAYSEELIAQARGCDVLIHEIYPESKAQPEKRPGGEFWPLYLRAFHTSDFDVGRVAAQVQPKLLILHHVVSRLGATDDEMIAAIRRGGYAGPVVFGRDLERY